MKFIQRLVIYVMEILIDNAHLNRNLMGSQIGDHLLIDLYSSQTDFSKLICPNLLLFINPNY
jgi:hypothetical protein